jgi:hypothetical protein
LENRPPASLYDMDESYRDVIICRDATLATDLPGRMLAGILWGDLVWSQSEERFQEDSDGLTSRTLHTARAMRVANALRGLYCTFAFDP